MKVTIKDIAKITGFSKATISLVLNNSDKISISTKRKVREAIAKLGYQPNLLARSFATQRAMTIGLVLPKVKHHLFSDPYFSEAISGLSAGINGSGYRLLFLISDNNFIHYSGENLFNTRAVDGYIFLGAILSDNYISHLEQLGCPVVMINNKLSQRISQVNIDNKSGAKNMVHHLYNLGYRRIAFIRGIETTLVGRERYVGFLEGMRETGCTINPDLIYNGDFTEKAGYDIVRGINKIEFDALFAANDFMAIGAINALKERGIRVPDDVAVVGADDIDLGRYIEPKLTTIHQPIYEASYYTAKIFIKYLQDKELPRISYTFPTEIIIRDSCGIRKK